jgi:hypothetical protein
MAETRNKTMRAVWMFNLPGSGKRRVPARVVDKSEDAFIGRDCNPFCTRA